MRLESRFNILCMVSISSRVSSIIILRFLWRAFPFSLLRHGFPMHSWLTRSLLKDQVRLQLTEIHLLLPLQCWNLKVYSHARLRDDFHICLVCCVFKETPCFQVTCSVYYTWYYNNIMTPILLTALIISIWKTSKQ